MYRKDDATVLERLPLRRSDPVAAELRKLRGAALARRYFELAMAQGDPRYVGYAEAALRDWRTTTRRPRCCSCAACCGSTGTISAAHCWISKPRCKRDPEHDRRALPGAPRSSWCSADYAAAREECRALEPLASELIATGCRAAWTAQPATRAPPTTRLKAALDAPQATPGPSRASGCSRGSPRWPWRLEQPAAAERHFRDALALGVRDDFLLAAYADFLLEQGRAAGSRRAAQADGTRSDTLLLRLALAAQGARSCPKAQKHAQALGERFAAAALRGERLHLGEEARFLLELKGDAQGALAAALENWKAQREPRDAQVLLEAALAARDRKAAAPVLRWLEESGFEDARLRRARGSTADEGPAPSSLLLVAGRRARRTSRATATSR